MSLFARACIPSEMAIMTAAATRLAVTAWRCQHEQVNRVTGNARRDHGDLKGNRQYAKRENGHKTVLIEECLEGLVTALHSHGFNEPGADRLIQCHTHPIAY